MQEVYKRKFGYGTVVQLCVARNRRRLSATRYKGVAQVTSRRARKGLLRRKRDLDPFTTYILLTRSTLAPHASLCAHAALSRFCGKFQICSYVPCTISKATWYIHTIEGMHSQY